MKREFFVAAALTWLGCAVANLAFALLIALPFSWAWNHFAAPILGLRFVSFTNGVAATVLLESLVWAYKGVGIALEFKKE